MQDFNSSQNYFSTPSRSPPVPPLWALSYACSITMLPRIFLVKFLLTVVPVLISGLQFWLLYICLVLVLATRNRQIKGLMLLYWSLFTLLITNNSKRGYWISLLLSGISSSLATTSKFATAMSLHFITHNEDDDGINGWIQHAHGVRKILPVWSPVGDNCRENIRRHAGDEKDEIGR